MKLFITLFIILMSLLLFGCKTTPKQVSIEVSCEDFHENQHISDEIEVAVGGTITLTLCSKPSTNLQWKPIACCPLVSYIIAEEDHKFIPPEEAGDTPPAPGTPGKEIWLYKAYNEGSATISLDYINPGESGGRGDWTYQLIVNVK